MSNFKAAIIGLLTILIGLGAGSKCLEESNSRHLLCYYKGEVALNKINVSNCTHLIFTNAVTTNGTNNTLQVNKETQKDLLTIKEIKSDLLALFTLDLKKNESSAVLESEKKSKKLLSEITNLFQEFPFDGVELNFEFSTESIGAKESYTSFVKSLSKTLESQRRRIKRSGYDVIEKQSDDITTQAYTTQAPKTGTTKTESIKSTTTTTESVSGKIREKKTVNPSEGEEVSTATPEGITEISSSTEPTSTTTAVETDDKCNNGFLLIVRLPIKLDIVGKKYDLKALSRYADILSVPTHNVVNENEKNVTYHPSRLMGLSDVLNTDSILDFLLGMGAIKSKIVISLPATVLKFTLKDIEKNTPRSPSVSDPQVIDQSELCTLFKNKNWTLERDEDLTAPYAYSGLDWLAFEDEISVNIKGKYILLRDLAGGAIYPIDADLSSNLCFNQSELGGHLINTLHSNFENLGRKPRALVLENLQQEIHDSTFSSNEVGVRLSEYRIVRVVDHAGAVHVIRRNTKTQFECSRQGYFSHPLGCNKFYRCVKFDQYSDDFTVFEYDCPAGLAFDERWEVCVWPGSLPNGAPCTGSSEIAPVPRSHYQCPRQEGFYGDPENCRWFFACLDHVRDGVSPLTAYEFRCPFGLVFNEDKLACDWPWIVGSCGRRGASGYVTSSSGTHESVFVNGGNLESSYGQYGKGESGQNFNLFEKYSGGGLNAQKGLFGNKNRGTANSGNQNGASDYIASQFDGDNRNRGSFALFPDYQISGGRIKNSEGVVLHNNVNLGGKNSGQEGTFSGTYDGSAYYSGENEQSNLRTSFQVNGREFSPKLKASFGQKTRNQYYEVNDAILPYASSTTQPFIAPVPVTQPNTENNVKYTGQSLIDSSRSHGTYNQNLRYDEKKQFSNFGNNNQQGNYFSGGSRIAKPATESAGVDNRHSNLFYKNQDATSQIFKQSGGSLGESENSYGDINLSSPYASSTTGEVEQSETLGERLGVKAPGSTVQNIYAQQSDFSKESQGLSHHENLGVTAQDFSAKGVKEGAENTYAQHSGFSSASQGLNTHSYNAGELHNQVNSFTGVQGVTAPDLNTANYYTQPTDISDGSRGITSPTFNAANLYKEQVDSFNRAQESTTLKPVAVSAYTKQSSGDKGFSSSTLAGGQENHNTGGVSQSKVTASYHLDVNHAFDNQGLAFGNPSLGTTNKQVNSIVGVQGVTAPAFTTNSGTLQSSVYSGNSQGFTTLNTFDTEGNFNKQTVGVTAPSFSTKYPDGKSFSNLNQALNSKHFNVESSYQQKTNTFNILPGVAAPELSKKHNNQAQKSSHFTENQNSNSQVYNTGTTGEVSGVSVIGDGLLKQSGYAGNNQDLNTKAYSTGSFTSFGVSSTVSQTQNVGNGGYEGESQGSKFGALDAKSSHNTFENQQSIPVFNGQNTYAQQNSHFSESNGFNLPTGSAFGFNGVQSVSAPSTTGSASGFNGAQSISTPSTTGGAFGFNGVQSVSAPSTTGGAFGFNGAQSVSAPSTTGSAYEQYTGYITENKDFSSPAIHSNNVLKEQSGSFQYNAGSAYKERMRYDKGNQDFVTYAFNRGETHKQNTNSFSALQGVTGPVTGVGNDFVKNTEYHRENSNLVEKGFGTGNLFNQDTFTGRKNSGSSGVSNSGSSNINFSASRENHLLPKQSTSENYLINTPSTSFNVPHVSYTSQEVSNLNDKVGKFVQNQASLVTDTEKYPGNTKVDDSLKSTKQNAFNYEQHNLINQPGTTAKGFSQSTYFFENVNFGQSATPSTYALNNENQQQTETNGYKFFNENANSNGFHSKTTGTTGSAFGLSESTGSTTLHHPPTQNSFTNEKSGDLNQPQVIYVNHPVISNTTPKPAISSTLGFKNFENVNENKLFLNAPIVVPSSDHQQSSLNNNYKNYFTSTHHVSSISDLFATKPSGSRNNIFGQASIQNANDGTKVFEEKTETQNFGNNNRVAFAQPKTSYNVPTAVPKVEFQVYSQSDTSQTVNTHDCGQGKTEKLGFVTDQQSQTNYNSKFSSTASNSRPDLYLSSSRPYDVKPQTDFNFGPQQASTSHVNYQGTSETLGGQTGSTKSTELKYKSQSPKTITSNYFDSNSGFLKHDSEVFAQPNQQGTSPTAVPTVAYGTPATVYKTQTTLQATPQTFGENQFSQTSQSDFNNLQNEGLTPKFSLPTAFPTLATQLTGSSESNLHQGNFKTNTNGLNLFTPSTQTPLPNNVFSHSPTVVPESSTLSQKDAFASGKTLFSTSQQPSQSTTSGFAQQVFDNVNVKNFERLNVDSQSTKYAQVQPVYQTERTLQTFSPKQSLQENNFNYQVDSSSQKPSDVVFITSKEHSKQELSQFTEPTVSKTVQYFHSNEEYKQSFQTTPLKTYTGSPKSTQTFHSGSLFNAELSTNGNFEGNHQNQNQNSFYQQTSYDKDKISGVGQYATFPLKNSAGQTASTPGVNFVAPSATPSSDTYTRSFTEKPTTQFYGQFESKKLNNEKGGSLLFSKNQFDAKSNSYAGTTSSSPSSEYQTTFKNSFSYGAAQNFTSDHAYSTSDSGIKSSFNPKVKIPLPPTEYFLNENLRDLALGKFGEGVKINFGVNEFLRKNQDSGYVLPIRNQQSDYVGKASSQNIFSAGNVNTNEDENNNGQFFDKNSERFGKVIGYGGEKFDTKVTSEEGKSSLNIASHGLTEVYGVTTAKPKQRQYHGSLISSSSLPATNKYEEYYIENENEFGSKTNSGGLPATTLLSNNGKTENDKKTVVVVSQVSDANPVLIDKLAGQCSCQSNVLELKSKKQKLVGVKLKRKKVKNDGQVETSSVKYYNENDFGVTPTAQSGLVDISSFPNSQASTTTSYTAELPPSDLFYPNPKTSLSGTGSTNGRKTFRGKARYLPPSSLSYNDNYLGADLFSPVSATQVVNNGLLGAEESKTRNDVRGRPSKTYAGAAFDRYGPGGWRGLDETLQGSVDCKRAGLFRHPKYCNKFYACHYDPWEEKFTLHVFNCPIRLTYDSSISACNWPVGGPACADDNLLV